MTEVRKMKTAKRKTTKRGLTHNDLVHLVAAAKTLAKYTKGAPRKGLLQAIRHAKELYASLD